MQTIKKSIDIHASKEQVWNVLFSDATYRDWSSAFSEGSYAETDWKQGSKVAFKDGSGSGLVGTITKSTPPNFLSIKYDAELVNGIENLDGDNETMVDGKETYTLSEQNGGTLLAIASDMTENMLDTMGGAWDKALLRIKELAENSK